MKNAYPVLVCGGRKEFEFMALKFSPNGLFRVEVERFVREKELELETGISSLSAEQVHNIRACVGELEGLSIEEEVVDPGERLTGPGVDIPVYILFYERSSDPQKTPGLFLEIHNNLKHTLVPIEIYILMSKAIEELNVGRVDPDLQIAIDAAIRQRAEMDFDRTYRPDFCPRVAIERQHKKSGPERYADW